MTLREIIEYHTAQQRNASHEKMGIEYGKDRLDSSDYDRLKQLDTIIKFHIDAISLLQTFQGE
jgi:hypothetical protein